LSYYNELRRQNIFRYVKRMFVDGLAVWDKDNQKKVRLLTQPAYLSPWHYTAVKDEHRFDPPMYCYIWKDRLYKYVFRPLCVPSHCHHCWKVVASIENVQQLFEVDELMAHLGYESKCGGELRGSTPRTWGAYWYTRSIEEGRARHREVKGLMAQNEILKDVEVILKRGCTEYEVDKVQGGTDKWRITPDQEHLEKLFYDLVLFDEPFTQQPEVIVDIKQQWIDHAAALGDPTAELFNDGKPIIQPIKTYHED